MGLRCLLKWKRAVCPHRCLSFVRMGTVQATALFARIVICYSLAALFGRIDIIDV